MIAVFDNFIKDATLLKEIEQNKTELNLVILLGFLLCFWLGFLLDFLLNLVVIDRLLNSLQFMSRNGFALVLTVQR